METPRLVKSAHTHNIYAGDDWNNAVNTIGGAGNYALMDACGLARSVSSLDLTTPKKAKENKVALRFVQVFIADPDESLPIENRLLYEGDQKVTDLTDQELFFEIDIKRILDAHNEFRVTQRNKKIKDRTENLEPTRIRDLKMVVVDIATF